MLNQTEIANNNNKFYIIQVLKDDNSEQYYFWNRWGRVGAVGQSKHVATSRTGAIAMFESKFSDKTRNQWANRAKFTKVPGKYFLIERDFGDDDEQTKEELDKANKSPVKIPDSKLDKRVQDLVGLISNLEMMTKAMIEIGYDAKKMPLGKLTKDNIAKGYEVLKQIAAEMEGAKRNNVLTSLSSSFYTIIPHAFSGRQIPPVINNGPLLKQKLEMVEALGDIQIAQTVLKTAQNNLDENPIDAKYHSLKCGLTPVDRDSETWSLIDKYTQNTHAATHNQYNLEVLDVFEVARDGEEDRFKSKMAEDKEVGTNRKLLWHGSRLTNFVGILSQGLRIAPPEAPVTGYMFGKGVYFADMVSKSANYCFTSSSQNTGVLLLCEVALGKENELLHSDYNADQNRKNNNAHSTKGCGGTAPDPKSTVTLPDGVQVPCGKGVSTNVKGHLLYNEFIVYDVAQIKVRYLIKMKVRTGSFSLKIVQHTQYTQTLILGIWSTAF
ncbi:poly polymerase catalytic domain-containing protein [Polychytrium aggregatum]|uniref:poly polymerase catalytic domain-containing protein n=1 Tax=Polychytrium aggregatum TaxID=110093 RepID=UPI0022FE57FE|nr:poly polymerase catalytic domain-containing protein [Polychytrium aggregatum]KAI9192960.1 poly polymerase catalytic domain-containing protein [Polychytrium aggregatum]